MQIKNLQMAILVGLIVMLTGCARVDQTTLAKIPGGGTSILNTDKVTYLSGEQIKVNFFNSPGNDEDWICIVPVGSPDTEGGDFKYMPKRLKSGSLLFDSPAPGKYEARAYYNYGRNGYVVTGRHTFSVVTVGGGGVSPVAQAGKAIRDDYVLFQSVTFGDTNKPLTGFSAAGSLAVVKTPNGNMVDYELWSQGPVSSGSNQKTKAPVYGPVRFSRNPTTEEVSFNTNGFGLDEDVINQIVRQVEKNPRVEGTWDQELSLKLLRSHLPRKLTFHFHVQKIELKPGVWALLVRTYTDVFKIDILPTVKSVDNGYFSGMYKGVLIYSPEDHRMYQMASSFDAGKNDETLQIQETAFLAGPDGKPVYPLFDMRKLLDLKKQDKTGPLVAIPLWAVQALKVREVVSLASVTTAERSSNAGGFLALNEAFQLISELSQIDSINGLAGLPSSGNLIETYAATYGEPAGQLAARFLGNLVLTGVGEVLPGAVLMGPVVPVALTAAAVYTIYSTMADLGMLVYYDQVLGKIEPFRWPQCAPMDCIAQADATGPIEPYTESESGPIPEPPQAPSSGWTSTIITGSLIAVAAGVSLGGASSGATGDGASSNDCSNYTTQVNKCGTTSGGIQFIGFLVPTRCVKCPNGSYNSGSNYNGSGGPYYQCICNGF